MKNNLREEILNRFNQIIEYNYGTTSSRRKGFYPSEEINEEEPNLGDDIPVDADNTQSDDMGVELDTQQPNQDGSPAIDGEFNTDFSASDELLDDENAMANSEVEEIDITDIVTKIEDTQNIVNQSIESNKQINSYIENLTSKVDNLNSSLQKMDMILNKINKLESDIKTPKEQLELRSLDSYPFNVKLSDFWDDKLNEPDNNYTVNNKEKVYKIDKKEISNFNDVDIKSTFNPYNQ
jgi:hypothetical protein